MTRGPCRGWLALSYLLCAAAGLASLLWRSPTVAAAGTWSVAWSILLIVGGLVSAAGVLENHWLGEFAGLPPLIAVWLVYGLTAGWVVVSREDLTRLPASLALISIASLLFWRWQTVAGDRQAARQLRGPDGG